MKNASLVLILAIGSFGTSGSRLLLAQNPPCATRRDSLAVVKNEIVIGADSSKPLAAGRWRSEVGCIEWASPTSKLLADRFETSRKRSQIAYVLAWVPMLYLVGVDVAKKRLQTSVAVAGGVATIGGVTISLVYWGNARRSLNDAVKEHNEVRQRSPDRF